VKKTYVTLIIFSILCLVAGSATGRTGDIDVMTISGSINPGVADFLKNAVDRASSDHAACLIIELDTPGGLGESMRQMVQTILSSPVPIVVYVSPSGARAASAGVMITMAADIAAMAPGTNIGAAHPVSAGGKDIESTMSEKVTNDMVAQARSVAEKRGRNADWVEKAIRKSVSITESQAVREKVVDLVATDLKDLIHKIDGREIPGKGKLRLGGAAIVRVKESLRTKILKTISDPNIAYILMLIGLAGLYFELASPGAVLPGVVGAMALILSFFAFQTLPVNYAGILLILLAVVFFILELKVTSYGMLSVAGIASLLLGSLMLFNRPEQRGLHLAVTVLLPSVFIVSGFFILVAWLVVRAHVARSRTGAEGMVGEIGVVKKALSPEGKVFVHGELWHAMAATPLKVGTRVRVKRVTNLLLEVEAVEGTPSQKSS
jgi:membrane-bound serine protease (ClpP class)